MVCTETIKLLVLKARRDQKERPDECFETKLKLWEPPILKLSRGLMAVEKHAGRFLDG